MNDTVTKILELADDFAAASHNYFTSQNSKERWGAMVAARQALQDELVRLFTPLTDEQIEVLSDELAFDDYAYVLTQRVEEAHGITGKKT